MTAEPSPLGRRRATIVAFTSHTGGIGRTGVVANLAIGLSLASQQVLVLDAGTEAPRVHEYLRPFHAETMPACDCLGDELIRALAPALITEPAAPALGQPDRSQLAAQQYRFPAGFGTIDVVEADPASPTELFSSNRTRSTDRLELREQLRSARYDYVLIDGPTDTSPTLMAQLALLCDVVAVCFTPQPTSTIRAGELAQSIRNAVRVSPRFIAMPLQFDDQDHDRAQQTRTLIQDVFAELLPATGVSDGPAPPAVVVEIPYLPHDALFDKALALLLDEPEREEGLSSAYRRLIGQITHGALDQLPTIPARFRLRYRFALGLESENAQPMVYLLYAPEDRIWADWVRIQLERGGARVARLPQHDEWRDGVGPQNVVVVSSPHLTRSLAGRRALALARQAAENPIETAPFDIVLVAVSDQPAAGPLARIPQISLVGCAEARARTRLMAHFVLVDRPTVGPLPAVLFPGGHGATGSMSNVPPRNLEFVGRGEELEAMRDHFVTAGGLRTWTLTGAAGIGKSEIAKEYAHRFALDYDLVWWIPADSRNTVRAGLAELGTRMALPMIEGVELAVFDALAGGQSYSRWLLIYDNADWDNTLEGLVPTSGAGHVIITSRSPVSTSAADVGQVVSLRSDDCTAILRNGVTGLSAQDAESVAALVEYLPLSIALATAWLREAAALLRDQSESGEMAAAWAAAEFRTRTQRLTHSVELTGQLPEPIPASMVAALALTVETLQADEPGQLALRLAQLCSFLAADGVSLRLLRSPSMLAALATTVASRAALTADPLELDRVLWTGTRFGLFEAGWERPASLHMHRLVQVLVRGLMTAEQRQACHEEVLQGLAAFAPTDAEGGVEQDRLDFIELQKHLIPSGAAASVTFEVRRWLVDQISFMYRESGGSGVLQFAAELGDRVLAGWEPTTDDELALRTRLELRLVNLHRSLDWSAEALLTRGERLVAELRRIYGPNHPDTLKAARGLGAELRGLGRFADACAEDRATLLGFRAVLGANHPDTLRAANNLAVSLFLAGDTPAALALAEENRDLRLALYGPDQPEVWRSACSVGIYLCELGRYEEALKVLDDALAHIVSLSSSGLSDELRIRRNRAIVRRRSGERLSATERVASAATAATFIEETLRGYQALYDADHSEVRACKSSYALAQYQIGNIKTAVELTEDCLRGYAQPTSDHPFAALCRTNLAMFLRAGGEIERALQLGRQSRDELSGWLGDQHPWALASRINYARILAEHGQVDQAMEYLRSTYEDCRGFLDRGHPYTLLAGGNLAGETDQWGDVGVDVP